MNSFRSALSAVDFSLDQVVSQKWDQATLDATVPYLSENTARRLCSDLKEAPLLFIPLAHGAVAAGMDVFLHYSLFNSKDNLFYPVRFSKTKHKDRAPRISPFEIAFLKKEVSGRVIVLFDEDKSTGRTILGAKRFFSELFPENSIYLGYNDWTIGSAIT
ncbi:MAG: hypothetical protein AABX70_07505 [Nanoarchaeota archaeon]